MRDMRWARVRACGMRVLRQGRATGGGAVVVLTYHRVRDTALDPLHLATPPSRFDEHVAAIAKRYELMTAGQLFRLMRDGTRLPRRGLVITLDDGYVDSLTNVLPILEAHGAPATVFVCSGFLDGTREFWWDELERVVLIDEEPAPPVSIVSPGAPAFVRKASTSRADLYRDLCAYFEPFTAVAREGALASVREAFGASLAVRPEMRALSPDEVVRLESGGLVEIGAHTVNHARLASLPEDDQHSEIATSKRDLEHACGHELVSFSYPYGTAGSFTADTARLVRQAGFLGAVTSEPGGSFPWGSASRGTDRFAVPRMATADVSTSELVNTIDKRLGL